MNDKYTKNMTEGDPKKIIISFAVPIFLSQLFQQLYNSVDSLIVGNFIGKDALAAVSSSGPLIFLLVSFFAGTMMGAGVVISRYFGAGKTDKVSKAIHTDVALGFVSGILLSVFSVIMTPYILRWMDTPPEVFAQSVTYFRYYSCGAVAAVMYNCFMGIMNALGDSRRPLYYLIFSSLLNVALDLLFVGVFGWGVGSAAVATVISQAASCVLCAVHLMKKDAVYQVEIRKIRFHRDMMGEIVRYGLPTGVQNSVIGFANVIVQSNINAFGDTAVAGSGAYSKLEGFAFLPITCFSMALSTFVSQNLGAGKKDRVKQAAKFGITTSLLLAEAVGAIIFIGAPLLIRIFSDDPEVIRSGALQCRIEALFYCLLSFSHCVAGICRGAGKAVVPMVVMLSVWCIFRIIYIETVTHFVHDIRLIFWAYPLTWTISSSIFLFYYLKVDWMNGFNKQVES